ncbi:LppA family lipoprotein [Spongisporangium articulatum]|uniref:LppA family lipoprotein n=1 Tax=Spongisporangium articulatum TaxID=3362603 RepID=A0ABW8ATG5_9ACTN
MERLTVVVRRRALRPVALGLLAVMLTGCPGRGEGNDMESAQAQLQARPSYEAAEADYLAMLNEMRAAFNAVNPDLLWLDKPGVFNEGFCAPPFSDVDQAASANYDSGDAAGELTPAQWEQAAQGVAAVGARHGFTHVERLKNGPSQFYVVLHGRWDDKVEFGYEANRVVLSVYGACFIRTVPATPYDPFTEDATPSS